MKPVPSSPSSIDGKAIYFIVTESNYFMSQWLEKEQNEDGLSLMKHASQMKYAFGT